MKYQTRFDLNHLEQTCSLGNWMARGLRSGIHFTLDGPIGAGKTTLVKSIIESLGIASDWVDSPTFTLVHEYQTEIFRIFHIDLYRLGGRSQFEDLGLDEILSDERTIFFVEWAYKVRDYLLFSPLIGIFIRMDTEYRRTAYFFSDDDESGFFFDHLAKLELTS